MFRLNMRSYLIKPIQIYNIVIDYKVTNSSTSGVPNDFFVNSFCYIEEGDQYGTLVPGTLENNLIFESEEIAIQKMIAFIEEEIKLKNTEIEDLKETLSKFKT